MHKINNLSPGTNKFAQIISTIDKPPISLYTIGELPSARRPAVAVVGTRKPTAYGREVGYRLAYELAQKGVVIISGLAIGMDGIAHQAALDADGTTLAVLPSSLDHIHPRTHHQLAQRIVESGGALMSEYPLGQQTYKANFLARNRIVAGLSDGVLIIEAAARSGTLATAGFALNQGKPVMAVPGPITAPMSEGCNRLIAQGARLITSVDDILEEIGLGEIKTRQLSLPLAVSTEQAAVLTLLKQGLRDGDELQKKSQLAPALFAQTLTMLELEGKVKPLGANQWAVR